MTDKTDDAVPMCYLALRNLTPGTLIGLIPVPRWDPSDPEDESRDLVGEAFDLAYPDHPIRPHGRADDGSCGTFTAGPMTGTWEWLDFGEQPVERGEDWARHVLQSLVYPEG